MTSNIEMTNKVIRGRFTGLKDIHIAKVTQDDSAGYKTETPFLLARAIQAQTTIKTNSAEVDSENTAEYVEDTFQEGELKLDVNDLSPNAKALLFGNKYDPNTGLLALNTGDKSNTVAVGWRGTRSNGCKQQLRWYYSVTFSPMNESFETNGKKTKVQESQLQGTIMGRSVDGNYGVVLDEEYMPVGQAATEILADWFSEVQAPNQGSSSTK
ncbi:MAG: major tail protein [Sarcina sp.]